MRESDIDLLGVFGYLFMMLCFGLLLDEVFLWLGFIGFGLGIVALIITWYIKNKGGKE